MNAAAAWWSGRAPRERRVLRAIAVLVAAVLLLLVWVDSERTRARLNAELPRLRASIAALERDAGEVQRLRALPAAPAGTQSPLATLATNGGGLPGAQIAIVDERRVKVTGSDVGFGLLLEWLRNAQVTHGMRVESARLDALPTTGRVRAELLLTRT